MSIIEEIKRDYADFVPHDDECDIYLTLRMKPACNCSRRRKIAWLERLEEPTEEMLIQGSMIICGKNQEMYRSDARRVLEVMLKAAGETQ